MAFTWQENQNTGSQSATSITRTYTGPVSTNDLLIGIFRADTATGFSVSDSVNGAWTQAWTITGGDTKIRRCYYVISASASPPIVTFSSGGSASIMVMDVDRFSTGGATITLDKTSTNSVGGSPWNAGNTASIAAGELVYAGGTNEDFSGDPYTAGSTNGVSMTIGGQGQFTNTSIFSEYALSSASGVQNSSATYGGPGGANVDGGQVTFLLGAAPPFPPLFPPYTMQNVLRGM